MNFQIVCTAKSAPCPRCNHSHVIKVGTLTPGGVQTWTVAEVYMPMKFGHGFYTCGPQSKKSVWVRKHHCRECNFLTLCTDEHDIDNSIDNLIQFPTSNDAATMASFQSRIARHGKPPNAPRPSPDWPA